MNTEINEEFNAMQAINRKAFNAMWKAISNSDKRKPTFVELNPNGSFVQKLKVKGFIYPEHHILYNLVRGLPTCRGFGAETDGYKNALAFFKSSYNSKHLNKKLYEPFENYMTLEEFEKVLAEAKTILKD